MVSYMKVRAYVALRLEALLDFKFYFFYIFFVLINRKLLRYALQSHLYMSFLDVVT